MVEKGVVEKGLAEGWPGPRSHQTPGPCTEPSRGGLRGTLSSPRARKQEARDAGGTVKGRPLCPVLPKPVGGDVTARGRHPAAQTCPTGSGHRETFTEWLTTESGLNGRWDAARKGNNLNDLDSRNPGGWRCGHACVRK